MTNRSWVLLVGGFISAVGDRFAAIAYALVAVATNSSGFLSAVFAAELVPPLLLGVLGGVVTDRHLRRWLWPAALLAQSGCFLGMARADRSWPIVALVAVSSCLVAVIGPVGIVLMRHVTVAESHAMLARWTTVSSGLAAVGGVLAAGVTFQITSRQTMFVVDAVTFVILALCGVLATRGVELPTRNRDERVRPRTALIGFIRLGSARVFGAAGVAMIVGVIFGTSLEGIVGVFFVRDVVGAGPALYGMIIGSWAAGMLLGPLFVRVRKGRSDWRLLMPVAAAAMGLCIAAPAITVNVWVTVVAFFLGGIANGLFNFGITATVFQGVVHAEQGRVWSAFGILAGAASLLGYLTGAGLGVDHARTTMLAAGLLPVAIAALTHLAYRRHQAEPGDAAPGDHPTVRQPVRPGPVASRRRGGAVRSGGSAPGEVGCVGAGVAG